MKKTELKEIKKGSVGTGLLIENDGYVSLNDKRNKLIKESLGDADEWHVPYPFIVSAVFQKYGIKNANGRIYPEEVLKKQVELYQQKIAEHRAIGECYTPDVMVLCEEGWKCIADVTENDNVLTLNVETNEIEVQKVTRKIEYDYNGNLIHFEGRNISESVTPNHGYPIYNRYKKFAAFRTAQEIMDKSFKDYRHSYIPKTAIWNEKGDEYFTLKGLSDDDITPQMKRCHPDCQEDKQIPMSTFMKFLGIYLSEGDFRKTNSDVNIYQVKENVCELILGMLDELGLHFTERINNCGCHIFRISDPRLNKYVSQFGNCYTKFIPKDIKNQSKENLRILYDWFVLGDGRIRGDKRLENGSLSDDVFSTSKQLIMDLNEIQLKIGYNGKYHCDDRTEDRYFGDRLIEGKNCKPLHFTFRSLTNGIYLDRRFLQITEEHYEGKVMCIEVPNHTFYVMSNGKCHWSKNCNHPAESTIDLGRISHNIIELHWEGRTLVGKMELNITEGFRRNGICSSYGDTVANLLMNGYKIGVSSRGVGSVETRLGQMIVGDDFELICWDVVSDPSTNGSWVDVNSDNLQQYVESTQTSENKTVISEKINKLKNILKN